MYENGDMREYRGYYSLCLMRYILRSILLINKQFIKHTILYLLKSEWSQG